MTYLNIASAELMSVTNNSSDKKADTNRTDGEVFFSTSDVAVVATQLRAANTEYEALFSNLGTQIYSTIRRTASAADKYSITLQYITDAITAFGQSFPDNQKLACNKGCHYCCYFPIDTSQQVIDNLVTHLKNNYCEDEIETLKEALRENITARKAPLYRAPCPFLDSANACSIYHLRPLSCRWFSSPDATLCEQSISDGRAIQQHPIHTRIYQAASTALLADQKNATGSDQQLAFIPTLLAQL